MDERLLQFLDESEEILGKVIHMRGRVLPADLQLEFLEAWEEIPGQFQKVRHRLQSIKPSVLQAAGLSGNQLSLKLAGFRRASQSFFRGFSFSALKRVLRWMNVLLGSLASVVPAAEIIKEYKEALEIGIDEAEEQGGGQAG